MKNIILTIISCLFLMSIISCTTTRAQQGALLGGYGGALGSVIGKGDRTTTAIIGGAGAALGYMIGNELDKQEQRRYNQSYNPAQSTECRKVLKRTVNEHGRVIETIEEICEGRKITNTY